MSLVAILTFFSTIVSITWMDFSTTISNNSVHVIYGSSGKKSSEPIDPNAGKPITFLLLGQDTREGKNNNFAHDGETDNHQSDTAMVVQISADRSYVNIVSIPRDSMVNAPECDTTRGRIPAREHVMFNSIFAYGYAQGGDLSSAASCSLKTVNSLTGLDIDNFIVADFNGLSEMINAIGGVDLCIPVTTHDVYTGVTLKRGMRHLNGVTATQYARMRHDSASDGSDIMRTTRQQYLIKQLVHQALSKNLLTESGQLYQLAKSALNSLNISSGLANPATLVGLAMSLHKLDTSHIYARTIPIVADPSNPNRVVWDASAQEVWEKMRENRPLTNKRHNASSHPKSSDNVQNDNTQNNSSDHKSEYGPVNPKTGLVKDSSGRLIDPNTGGIVNPEDGTIRDPNTGYYMGIADKYINNTICAVPKS
ncbi:LCP family protein [Gardnerella vaginalis]|nr:LCP family protein [Gardnerella vaginalis]